MIWNVSGSTFTGKLYHKDNSLSWFYIPGYLHLRFIAIFCALVMKFGAPLLFVTAVG